MKLLVAAAAGVIACGPGLHDPSQYRNPELADFAAQLETASHAHDVAKMRALLHDEVTIAGIWFADVTCTREFAAPGDVTGPRLDDLARCLAGLELTRSERSDALPDVVVLTYGPGIELEARLIDTHDGPWLAWIGYVARRNLQDALPTITPAALEQLRLAGDPQAPLAGPSTFASGTSAWLKICIDRTGAVSSAQVREATSPHAARAFADATKTWQFRPLLLGGQPAPACAMLQMTYPASERPPHEQLPLPVPDAPEELTNVPSRVLERVAGTTLVVPDDIEKVRLQKAHLLHLVSAFHFCIDTTGHVSRVAILRSSGLPGYDRKLVAAIGGWSYKPFLDEGTAVPVCSSVHFVYRQR
jgi:TonB family protein